MPVLFTEFATIDDPGRGGAGRDDDRPGRSRPAQPADALGCADRRRGLRELQHAAAAARRGICRGEAERAPDVLLVDQAVGERDPTAEPGRQPRGFRCTSPGVRPARRGPVPRTPADPDARLPRAPGSGRAAGAADQSEGARQLLVADHVGDHVAHPPLVHSVGAVPLLGGELVRAAPPARPARPGRGLMRPRRSALLGHGLREALQQQRPTAATADRVVDACPPHEPLEVAMLHLNRRLPRALAR